MNTGVGKIISPLMPIQKRKCELIRVLLISNFIVLLALIGPGSSHELYLERERSVSRTS